VFGSNAGWPARFFTVEGCRRADGYDLVRNAVGREITLSTPADITVRALAIGQVGKPHGGEARCLPPGDRHERRSTNERFFVLPMPGANIGIGVQLAAIEKVAPQRLAIR
jgi:hypothetical protein